MADDLEADSELEDSELEDEAPAEDVDPVFAADMAETGLDLDDAQLAALQRAMLGLMQNMGGGGAPPAATAPMF